jgi:predicted MFS family arabinose efflux permease
VGCFLTIVMVLIYTHLSITPLLWVIVVNCILFVGVMARMIASSSLVSAIPSPTDRGSYMAISGSIQQVSGGVAALVGGLIVTQTPSGQLLHFDIVGYVLVASTLITLAMMNFISRLVEGERPAAVVMVESPIS